MAATASVRERSVGRLHLRAADAVQARRGALCIEDALRCASLPGAGASLLLVRRLALGRVDPAAPSHTIALTIERYVRGLSLRWWHGADDAAARADAVWFADRSQALASLALRAADGRSTGAWYWARLLPPDLAPALHSGAALLPAVLLALSREPAARAALPVLVVALLQRWPPGRLADAVGPVVGAALLHNAGIVATQARWIERLVELAPTATTTDTDTATATEAAPVSAERAGVEPSMTASPAGADALPPRHPPANLTQPAGTAARLGADQATHDALAAPLAGRRAGTARLPPALPFEATVPTAAGGCLFLLPLLDSLGFAAWNETADPDQRRAIAVRLLRQALQRLQVPADDAMQRLLALQPGEPPDEPANTLAAHWLDTCRRTLRRQLGIGLASLVLRPAQLAATRSHIDVFFALNATDLRVRRHGLDVNPGWLPWFGRVVAFHFDRQ